MGKAKKKDSKSPKEQRIEQLEQAVFVQARALADHSEALTILAGKDTQTNKRDKVLAILQEPGDNDSGGNPSGNPISRYLDPPLVLNGLQLGSLIENASETTQQQVIYAYDNKGWVLVGNDPDSEGDGEWMNERGEEMHP